MQATNRISGIITKIQADERLASVDHEKPIAYTFFLDLEKGDNYHGFLECDFFTTEAPKTVFFDYVGDSVESLNVNGTIYYEEAIKEITKEGKIWLNPEWLTVGGRNNVQIKFHNRYYRDGNGIHTYIDTDGKQYMYINSEPYDANRVIPCMDQPDLKATFKRFIAVPQDWIAVTAEPVQWEGLVDDVFGKSNKMFINKIQQQFPQLPKDKKLFEYQVSKAYSTYLNCLFAGSFYRFDLKPEETINNIPMAVYCRETLKEFVETQVHDIFVYHKKAIEFYSDFFSFPYPFPKCDAIFCPEYTMGAMEYPGGISYSEQRYLFRSKTTSTGEKSERGRVILHEMAHMWFGDTVTMKWWDGLWLNESFADFCCFEAWAGIQDSLGFPAYDGRFAFLNRKLWGYREDAMITTHPIQLPIADTEEALSIFDGISYPKGAAVIKQLMTVLGEQRFKAAMVEYFKRFAYKNTQLKDLLDCCEEQIKGETHPIYNLKQWKEMYLEKAGLNWAKAEWNPASRGPSVLTIHQGAVLAEHPTLRYHKMGVAFLDAEGKILEEKLIIVNNSEKTEIEYNGDLKPQAVLLNHWDKAFIRVIYDDVTLQFLLENIHKLETILNRGLCVKYINDSFKTGLLSVDKYFPFIFNYVRKEQNSQLLMFVLTEISEILNLLPRTGHAGQVFDLLLEKLGDAQQPLESDMLSMMFSSLISLADNDQNIHELRLVIEGKSAVHHLKQVKFSLSQHWNIIYLIQASQMYSPEDKKNLIDEQEKADHTDSKKEWKLKIRGMTSTAEEHLALVKQVFGANDLSYKEVEYLCNGLRCKHVKDEIKENYFAFYFENFLQMVRSINVNYSRTLRVFLMPTSSKKNDLIIEHLNSIVAQLTDKEKPLKKALLMTLDTALVRKRLSQTL
jgi:aminopeptidase N